MTSAATEASLVSFRSSPALSAVNHLPAGFIPGLDQGGEAGVDHVTLPLVRVDFTADEHRHHLVPLAVHPLHGHDLAVLCVRVPIPVVVALVEQAHADVLGVEPEVHLAGVALSDGLPGGVLPRLEKALEIN